MEDKKEGKENKITFSDRVNNILEIEGLPGITYKLDICTTSNDLQKSHHQVNYEMTIYDISRCWIEDSCRLASELLRRGVSVEFIVEKWRGTYGFPSGMCTALHTMGGELMYKGPLSAVAILLEKKMPEWRELMLTNS